ncbi:MAG: Ig-like domain-containing protein [Lachnoclostridium sp.]|nr:Ig-like domain-containing protein [Lachnoclostridium sp.]
MKTVKKLLCGLLVMCMVVVGITVVPQTVQAETASGDDGEIHWEIKGDTLTLSAVKGTKGEMKDYTTENKPQWAKSNQITKVKNIFISNGITKLGTFAFFQLDCKIDKFIIPSSVDTVPSNFVFCMEINKIVLCDGIKTVEDEAFSITSVNELYSSRNTYVSDVNFIHPADGCYTNLQTVYTYSGSSAETMINNFIRYAKESDETGGVTSTNPKWDGKYFGILDENGKCVFSINVVLLDKTSTLSKAKATSSISVTKGKSQTIKITLPTGFTKVTKYSGNPADVKVTFKSSNPKVATVSSSGKVTGKKKGTAKITVTMQIKNGAKKTVTTKVTVK